MNSTRFFNLFVFCFVLFNLILFSISPLNFQSHFRENQFISSAYSLISSYHRGIARFSFYTKSNILFHTSLFEINDEGDFERVSLVPLKIEKFNNLLYEIINKRFDTIRLAILTGHLKNEDNFVCENFDYKKDISYLHVVGPTLSDGEMALVLDRAKNEEGARRMMVGEKTLYLYSISCLRANEREVLL